MIQFFLVFSDWGIFALRVALGLILIAHGIPKLKNLKNTAEGFSGMGFRPGIFWAIVAGLVEIFGGLGLIVGLFTQIIALLVIVEFLIIIVKVRRMKGLGGSLDLDLLILGAALLLLTIGGGPISLERYFGLILY